MRDPKDFIKKTVIRKGILLLLFSALSGVLKSVEAQDSNTTMTCSEGPDSTTNFCGPYTNINVNETDP